MDHNNIIECGGFYFIHNFDSGNLGHVERVPTELIASTVNPKTNATETPDYEFNLWTRPDCAGTEFENGNRTWFYFGVQAPEPASTVRLNLINLNKQGKMYNQGMAPVTRTLPGKPQWERIRDRPVHSTDDNTFTLSFKYRTSENLKATTFFAFTYPFSFAELQIALNSIDLKMLPLPTPQTLDDIYYCRECLVYSLEGRRVDLLTISSHHGITTEREERLKNLFPDNQERAFKFQNKKVIFISARVHPGETPSSFVFNGFLNLILTRNDPIAIQLRKLYVFKMIPFLNPDGVARGHYRTDTRGVNLNRVYLNPSLVYHPTVYASRALIRYYHFGCEKEDTFDDSKSFTTRSIQNINESVELIDTKKKKSSSTTYKSGDVFGSKREKSAKATAATKSSTTIKRPSTAEGSKKDMKVLSGEAANLVEQVYDLKLREMPSQTSEESVKVEPHATNNPSLLNDNVLSDSSLGGKESSRLANVRMGWCRECRLAVAKLEDTMPGIATMVPGYSANLSPTPRMGPPTRHNSIDEYREHQRKQQQEMEEQHNRETLQNLYYLHDMERADKDEIVYFCTNCFKRYVLSEYNEEIKLESVSVTSVGVSAGDSGDGPPAAPPAAPSAAHHDQSASPSPPPVAPASTMAAREEKPKSPAARQLKKKPAAAAPSAPAAGKPRLEPDSGLYLYIDLHGHASKKGIFMYGNHFEDVDSSVECMLLPRVMALNNLHFHFSSCNFTERNMYLKDRRDGMSREGSGRVAVLKATGLVRSYTLECNYNTGRLVNVLPPTVKDAPGAPATSPTAPMPPKYTPHIFEEVGRSLGASILDLTGQHPNSRVPCSEHRNLAAVREWLRAHTRTMRPQLTMSRLRPKTSSPTRVPLYARSKGKVVEERKENTYAGAKSDSERKRSPEAAPPPPPAPLARFGKVEPTLRAERARYLADNEPKPKSLVTKRRGVLAIRKPNTSKSQPGAALSKPKLRRSADEAETSRTSVNTKLGKRSFSRTIRSRDNRCRAMASSSSDDMVGGNWEEVAGGTALGSAAISRAESLSLAGKRRPFPNPSPSRLKKIRLKTGL